MGVTFGGDMEVYRSLLNVVGWWEVFAEVVSVVLVAGAPVDCELPLFNAILEPIKPHVNGLGAALLDSAIKDSFGTLIVGFNWCGWLLVS